MAAAAKAELCRRQLQLHHLHHQQQWGGSVPERNRALLEAKLPHYVYAVRPTVTKRTVCANPLVKARKPSPLPSPLLLNEPPSLPAKSLCRCSISRDPRPDSRLPFSVPPPYHEARPQMQKSPVFVSQAKAATRFWPPISSLVG